MPIKIIIIEVITGILYHTAVMMPYGLGRITPLAKILFSAGFIFDVWGAYDMYRLDPAKSMSLHGYAGLAFLICAFILAASMWSPQEKVYSRWVSKFGFAFLIFWWIVIFWGIVTGVMQHSLYPYIPIPQSF